MRNGNRIGMGWVGLLAGILISGMTESRAESYSALSLKFTDEFIFTPNSLSLGNFTLGTDFSWSWVPGSFEWTRADRKFLIPRARARIRVPEGAVIRYQNRSFGSLGGEVEVPVVLSGEKGNELEVAGPSGSKPIVVRFSGAERPDVSLVLDSSCSQVPFRWVNQNLGHSWVHLHCRTVHHSRESGTTQRIDLEFRWETESPGARLKVNGVEAPSEDGITHAVSITPRVHSYRLEKGQDSLEFEVPVPEVFHPLSISVGLGPYSHQGVTRAFPTFYIGYYLSEFMRLASFSAVPLKPNPEIDTGLYLVSEQFRGVDERFHMSLLLGAHVLSFYSEGKHYSIMSAPQGVEVGFRDFLIRKQNLMFGSFFYPKINNRSYINTWLRFGNSRLFYEFNFINWQEPTDSGSFTVRSMGVSVGFPIARLL